LAALDADAAPDVFIADLADLEPLARRGDCMDLARLVARDKAFREAVYLPGVRERSGRGDIVDVVPIAVVPCGCLIFNQKLFAEAGIPCPSGNWTWDELSSAAKRLSKRNRDGTFSQYGFAEFYDEYSLQPAIPGMRWVYRIHATGGSVVDDAGNSRRITVDSRDTLRGIQFLQRIYAESGADDSGPSGFANGRTAMLACTYLTVFGTLSDPKGIEMGAVPFPPPPGGVNRFFMHAYGIAIRSGTRHPRDAWRVIKLLAGADGQVRLALQDPTGGMPALRTAAERWAVEEKRKPGIPKVFLEMANQGVVVPRWERWYGFLGDILGLAGERTTWAGAQDAEVEEAMADAAALAKLRYFPDTVREAFKPSGSGPPDASEASAFRFLRLMCKNRMGSEEFKGYTDAFLAGYPKSQRLAEVERMTMATAARERWTSLRYLGGWKLAGPYPFDPGKPIGPQRYAPEMALDQPGADLPGNWVPAKMKGNGVDIRATLNFDNRIAYAVARFKVVKGGNALLEVSSDDSVEVWLNGTKIHTNQTMRALDSETDEVMVSLRPGTNVILAKVGNGGGDWAVRVAVRAGEKVKQ